MIHFYVLIYSLTEQDHTYLYDLVGKFEDWDRRIRDFGWQIGLLVMKEYFCAGD